MPKNLVYTAILTGLAGSITFILFFWVMYLTHQNPFLAEAKSPDFFVYMGVIVIANILYRFKINEGRMRFWEGFMIGGVGTILMASIGSLFVYVFLEYLHPEVLEAHVQYLTATLTENPKQGIESFGEENYKKIVKDIKDTSPSQMAFLELRVKLLIGTLMSLIVAAVVRK
jgi:hypothetical protein